MRAITLDEAVKIINETFAEAKRRNAYPLTAVLLDAGGRMKATAFGESDTPVRVSSATFRGAAVIGGGNARMPYLRDPCPYRSALHYLPAMWKPHDNRKRGGCCRGTASRVLGPMG